MAFEGAVAPGAAAVTVFATVTLVGFFIVVVLPAVLTLIVGCDTVPAGVYVAVPDDAALTVAVLFVVVSATEPAGVKLPVDVGALPLNVGCDTVPAGVYVAVPDDAALTVAVLFVVALVVTVTLPAGVKLPVDVSALPLNVGCDTVPAGV